MSRLDHAFRAAREEGRPALVAYVMAGHPDLQRHADYARAVLAECDVLEIGVPFSDPVADGPVIERAATRALEGGAKLQHALDLARTLRSESPKPLVFMTYYNPVLRRGLARFAREAREAGVDGVILPDVPLEESGPAGEALAAEGVDLIQLASPATSPERLARIAKATRGFLYVVSSFGVTGARATMAAETEGLVKLVAHTCRGTIPFAVGFGVSTSDHVRALHAAGAEGVVVGSAIVKRVDDEQPPGAVRAFVAGLRA